MAELKWKKFEKSVAQFVTALDPTAKVGHDTKLLDIHTKTPRQRDVWVEAKVCQHFPIKALISCKRYKRKLNQEDFDAFNGELISSGAQLGVIYSYSGFGANAIEKAKALGISCCRLFENQSADIPESLVFMGSYCCSPRISLSVAPPLDPYWKTKNWNDLFSILFNDNGSPLSVIDAIVRSYHFGEKEALEKTKSDFFPSSWARILECTDDEKEDKSLKIIIRGHWSIYEGRLEAHLLDGSYNFSSGEFLGSLSTPFIDTFSSHPGPAWTLLKELPSKAHLRPLSTILIKTVGNAKNALIEQLGPKDIKLERIEFINKKCITMQSSGK